LNFPPKWPSRENDASFPGKELFSSSFHFEMSEMEDVTRGNARAIRRRQDSDQTELFDLCD
jgi:hypothetical protein